MLLNSAQGQRDVGFFAERLAQASPQEIIEAAASAMPDRLAVVSSFGIESAVLLKFVADVKPSLPILFLDTLWLFKETLSYRDLLIARLGLTDVRTITPSPSALAVHDSKRDLCFRDRDACCGIRKIIPLGKELEPFDGWVSGRKRYHGGERAEIAIVETGGIRLKFNPLAHLTSAELNVIFETTGLPRHPLEALGYGSVGCIPCTSRPASSKSVRSGRWSGLAKTECGILAAPIFQIGTGLINPVFRDDRATKLGGYFEDSNENSTPRISHPDFAGHRRNGGNQHISRDSGQSGG